MAIDNEKAKGHVALKGFFGICREWDCTQGEMMQLLGSVSSQGHAGQVSEIATRNALAGYPGAHQLHPGHLQILGVMYPTAERANLRIRLETSEPPFLGASALDFMALGSMKHLAET